MLKLYDTLTGVKRNFIPQEKGKVKIYTCGPTVYDYPHIGNFTAYIYADILRRYLEYLGYEVRHIVNITDVGHLTDDDIGQADSGQDKMLKAALREKKTPLEIANFYTNSFFEDVEKLNIKKASYYPRATSHIQQMIKIIQGLIDKGLAYEKNGNVFYDVKKFSAYGKLSKKKLDDLKVGARLEEHPDKKNPYDFALWLKAPKKHLLKWESPWSLGYPGWHIECSAMSMEYLGETLDIHTGGEDHIFPHHENEIAQSEGFTGKPFSNFWLHNRFLLVDGAKMSKSKGNFYRLADILEKGYQAVDFRLLVISSHYRSTSNFTWDAMDQAKKNRKRLQRFIEKLKEVENSEVDSKAEINLDNYQKRIDGAMNDDLNTPLALSILFELVSKINKKISLGEFSSKEASATINFWNKINSIFGLVFETTKKNIPADVLTLAKQRQEARENKNFKKADIIRAEIEAKGFLIEDSKNGQKLKKI
jgi:cysteinyl-tRNA synthetase